MLLLKCSKTLCNTLWVSLCGSLLLWITKIELKALSQLWAAFEPGRSIKFHCSKQRERERERERVVSSLLKDFRWEFEVDSLDSLDSLGSLTKRLIWNLFYRWMVCGSFHELYEESVLSSWQRLWSRSSTLWDVLLSYNSMIFNTNISQYISHNKAFSLKLKHTEKHMKIIFEMLKLLKNYWITFLPKHLTVWHTSTANSKNWLINSNEIILNFKCFVNKNVDVFVENITFEKMLRL